MRKPGEPKGHKGPDDAALWRAVAATVKPLAQPKPVGPHSMGPLKPRAAHPAPPRGAVPVLTPRPVGPPALLPPELRGDRAPGLDRRTHDRLRRGQLPIDGRLDLHGLDRDAAHGALARFLAQAEAQGRRCVLVITGKGVVGDAERGVLKRELPRWLNQPENRGRVLAFAAAQARHGGAGALYVLLKRRRNEA